VIVVVVSVSTCKIEVVIIYESSRDFKYS